MPYGTLDISYRAPGQTIPVLVNPNGPRELDDFCADTRPIVRFALNAAGFIWFGRAEETLHGDEFKGRLVVEARHEKVGLRAALEAPRLVSGVLFMGRSRWKVRLFESVHWDPWRGNESALPYERQLLSERSVLYAFSAWHRAVNGVADLLWLDGMPYEEQIKYVDPKDMD